MLSHYSVKYNRAISVGKIVCWLWLLNEQITFKMTGGWEIWMMHFIHSRNLLFKKIIFLLHVSSHISLYQYILFSEVFLSFHSSPSLLMSADNQWGKRMMLPLGETSLHSPASYASGINHDICLGCYKKRARFSCTLTATWLPKCINQNQTLNN